MLFAILTASACGSKPVLIGKNPQVPVGTDLSGFWLLRESADKIDSGRRGDGEGIFIPPEHFSRTTRPRPTSGPSVQVFIEYGTSLKISQTDFGLFISYDRSVVEEFRFGENREVTIGPIEAMRVSGWEGTSIVVETLDKSGAVLIEKWRLIEDGSVLARELRIMSDEKQLFHRQQLFDRK